MRERATQVLSAVVGGAIIAVVVLVGWLGFGLGFGADRILDAVDMTDTGGTIVLSPAPASQCADIRKISTDGVMCVADRDFLIRFLRRCAETEPAGGMVYLDAGKLAEMPTCAEEEARGARRLLAHVDEIPEGATIADLLAVVP